MPEGSSSEAPVIRPGPSDLTKLRKLKGVCGFGVGFSPPCVWQMCSGFGWCAMPLIQPSDNEWICVLFPARIARLSITPRCDDGVQPVVAEHMGGEIRRAEDFREGLIADAQAPGIGAE